MASRIQLRKKSIDEIELKLTDNFNQIKEFCESLDLKINTDKTQCILLKLPSKKLDKQLELQLGDVRVEASSMVKVLGLTIDQHLSFKQHIETKVKTCHGLLGLIKKASGSLPMELLKLSYTALVRPHLEYCSLVLAGASNTNLMKLETLQKIASRQICKVPRDTHSDPLLKHLGLQTLKERREIKTIKTVNNILNENTHPLLFDMFTVGDDGTLTDDVLSRTIFAKKKFSSYAKDVYNMFLLKD